MTMKSGAWLEDLTWQEARARFDAGAIVVVPVSRLLRISPIIGILGAGVLVATRHW